MNDIEQMINRSLQELETIAVRENILFDSEDVRYARTYVGEIIPECNKEQIIEDIMLAESGHQYIQWVDFTLYNSTDYGQYISVSFVLSKQRTPIQFHVGVNLSDLSKY